jgi:Zn-dependent protease/predicted transcriptional regulator
MFGRRWRVFRLLGFPIYLDFSWLIVLALVSWTLADDFVREVPDLPPFDYWVLGIGSALVYFICLVLHELGHSVVARAQGIPIRGITLFLFGGVSELKDEPRSAGEEFLMAIAGPAVTAVLSALFFLLWLASDAGGWAPAARVFLRDLFLINFFVLIFNLLPAFPVDGGRVFRSILWAILRNLRRATFWASAVGQAIAWVMIAGGVFLVFWDAKDFLLLGIWLGLIGLFLNTAAQGTYQQLILREALKGEPVRRFMNTQPIVVPRSLDLQHWVEDYVYRYHRKVFPVATDGHLEGVMSTRALMHYPREEWGDRTVGEAMMHDLRPITISPDTDALHALTRMQRTGLSRLLVTENDKLVGIVSLKDLMKFFQLKLQLEDEREGK